MAIFTNFDGFIVAPFNLEKVARDDFGRAISGIGYFSFLKSGMLGPSISSFYFETMFGAFVRNFALDVTNLSFS